MEEPNQFTSPASLRPLLIGLIIVIGLIVIGLFFWNQTLTTTPSAETNVPIRPTAEENNEPESTTAEAAVETLGALSPSTELDAIAADLDATVVSDLAIEFQTIELELGIMNNLEVQ